MLEHRIRSTDDLPGLLSAWIACSNSNPTEEYARRSHRYALGYRIMALEEEPPRYARACAFAVALHVASAALNQSQHLIDDMYLDKLVSLLCEGL